MAVPRRPPARLFTNGMPLVRYAPFSLTLLVPFHQIHCPLLCWYSQISLRNPVGCVILEPYPQPPKNHRLLEASVQPTGPTATPEHSLPPLPSGCHRRHSDLPYFRQRSKSTGRP